MARADFRVTGQGTVYMVEPLSEAAKSWTADNVNTEDWQWMGSAFAVDHHYIAGLVEGIRAHGFVVEEAE